MSILEYAVFGSNRNAQLTKQHVNAHFQDKKISYFIENQNFGKIGSITDGIPVISLYAFKELYHRGKLKGVLIPSEHPLVTMRAMRERIREIEVAAEDVFAVPVILFRKDALKETVSDEEHERIFTPYHRLVQIYDLLFNIAEHCNLNCRSCIVFSNLVENAYFYELDVFERDVRRLRSLIPAISSIGVLGGEPFLNKDLPSYLRILRMAYPHANITLTTNGILLPSVSQETWAIIRETRVTVHLSLYPPMKHRVDDFISIFRKNGISWFVSDITGFHNFLFNKPHFNKEQSARRCTYTCAGLRNGRLSRCEFALYTGYLNEKFGTTLPENAAGGGIDIHDPSLTGEMIMRELEKPLDLCAWCASGCITDKRPWAQSRGNDLSEDFFISTPLL